MDQLLNCLCFGSDEMEHVEPPSKALTQSLLIPMYIYPTNYKEYDRLLQAKEKLGERLQIIVNPNNGDEAVKPPNEDWQNQFDRFPPNQKSFGYVYVSYGKRSMEQVKAVISGYFTHWSKYVDKIFVDEVDCNTAAYLTEVYSHCMSSGATCVVLNPGIHPSCTFPGPLYVSFENYCAEFSPEVGRAGTKQLCAIVHSVTSTTTALKIVNETADYAMIFITSQRNYHSLPPFFEAMVDHLIQHQSIQ